MQTIAEQITGTTASVTITFQTDPRYPVSYTSATIRESFTGALPQRSNTDAHVCGHRAVGVVFSLFSLVVLSSLRIKGVETGDSDCF